MTGAGGRDAGAPCFVLGYDRGESARAAAARQLSGG